MTKALLTDDASAAARRERVSACPPKSACFPWGPFRAPCNATQRSLLPVFCDPTQPFAARARELVSKLTLAEKVSQLSNGKPPQPIPRLGIPAYEWWGEASHGIATSASVTFRPPTPSATSFPEQIGTAASFDAELFGMVGEAIGKEARAMMNAGNGYSTFWAPVVNLAREPRWGRNIETAGEDPYHLGQYAEAFVKGMQVYDDDPEHIMAGACCKHYVANS